MSKSEVYLINLNTKAAALEAVASLLVRDDTKVEAAAGQFRFSESQTNQ